MRVKLYTDGGARGNPGPAAAAFVLQDADGQVIDTILHGLATPLEHVPGHAAALLMVPMHALIHVPVSSVSGQAVPRVARVDDRTIDCATPLDAAHLLTGSIVTTDPAVPVPRQPDDVELVQIAGPGAGRSRTLPLGRYRIGPGRRVRADELSFATVEEPAFEITVATDGVVTVGATGDRRFSSVRIAAVRMSQLTKRTVALVHVLNV